MQQRTDQDANPFTTSVRRFDMSSLGFSIPDDLVKFDLPSVMVQSLLRAFRHVNTAADTLFYDVGLLWLRLLHSWSVAQHQHGTARDCG